MSLGSRILPVDCLRFRFVLLCLASCAVWLPAADARAAAHPVSVTQAVVYVQREQITVSIEVFVEDLYLFHGLKPVDDFLPADDVRRGIRVHEAFLLERFHLRDVRGELLEGHARNVQAFELGPEGVAMDELMLHKITYEFEYPLAEPPEFLTIDQELADETLGIPVEMSVRIKQEGAGSPFFAVLNAGEPQTVRFSWDHPPLSAEASEEEWQEWLRRQEDETLGITSYSSVYSFLYIEDHEVRHEILIPLLTLETSILVPRDDDPFLEVDEQAAARGPIAECFLKANPVEIDGRPVAPRLASLDFFGLDSKDYSRAREPSRVAVASARVGVILVYPADAVPQNVSVTWDLWNRHVWTVESRVFTEGTIKKFKFARLGDENKFTWTNPGAAPPEPLEPVAVEAASTDALRPWRAVHYVCLAAIPLAVLLGIFWRRPAARLAVALVVAGLVAGEVSAVWRLAGGDRARLPATEAMAVFGRLHENLYRAFDYRRESEVYDALAASVDGQVLEDLYLEVRRGLVMEDEGGAVSRIHDVRRLDGKQLPNPDHPSGFDLECAWTVTGSVEHWGHIHTRTNQYLGRFSVEPVDRLWKITGVEMLDHERTGAETQLRRN